MSTGCVGRGQRLEALERRGARASRRTPNRTVSVVDRVGLRLGRGRRVGGGAGAGAGAEDARRAGRSAAAAAAAAGRRLSPPPLLRDLRGAGGRLVGGLGRIVLLGHGEGVLALAEHHAAHVATSAVGATRSAARRARCRRLDLRAAAWPARARDPWPAGPAPPPGAASSRTATGQRRRCTSWRQTFGDSAHRTPVIVAVVVGGVVPSVGRRLRGGARGRLRSRRRRSGPAWAAAGSVAAPICASSLPEVARVGRDRDAAEQQQPAGHVDVARSARSRSARAGGRSRTA